MSYPVPKNESARLQALRKYRILDTPPEPVFDDFVKLAAIICETPVATITLVDANRQWFKARVGLDTTQTPREQAFCAHTILSNDMMIVENAQEDARFADNPLVKGGPQIRFYAGAPLVDHDGNGLGTLCVIDREPRTLSAEQKEALGILGRRILEHFDLRLVAADLAKALSEMKILQELLPICSYCKSIRNDQGYWHSVEAYMSEHAGTGFSHGICPSCVKEHFPDIHERWKQEGKL